MAKYIQSFGGRSFIAIVAIFTIAAQAMEIVMPAWLSAWSQAYISSQSPNLGFFIGIFSGLSMLLTQLRGSRLTAQALVLWRYYCWLSRLYYCIQALGEPVEISTWRCRLWSLELHMLGSGVLQQVK